MTTNWGAGNIGNVGSFGNFGNFGNFGQPPSILNNNSTTTATANTTNDNNVNNNGNSSSNVNNQSDSNANGITGQTSSNTNTSNSTTATKAKNQPQPSMNVRLGNANPTANTPKLANVKISTNNVAAAGATSAANSPAASVAQMIAPPGLQRTMTKTSITNEDAAAAAAAAAPGLNFQQLQRQQAQQQASQSQSQQQQMGQQLQQSQQSQVQSQQQIYGSGQLHQQVQIPNLTPAQQQQQFLLGQTQGNGNASSAAAAAAGSTVINGKATETDESNFTDIDRFGLKGLATMLGMPNTEQTKIAMGSDLLMTGYNLDSNDKLLPTFQSPWVETSIKDVEPAYKLPDSVKHLNKEKFKFLRPAENRISDYPEDTLFFIFYSKPKDILQELAARELRERNWRFHKVLKVWLAKVKEVEPIQETALSERGVYTFFDPQTWQRVTKEFILEYSAIL